MKSPSPTSTLSKSPSPPPPLSTLINKAQKSTHAKKENKNNMYSPKFGISNAYFLTKSEEMSEVDIEKSKKEEEEEEIKKKMPDIPSLLAQVRQLNVLLVSIYTQHRL